MTTRRTADVGGVTVALDHYVNGERVGSADTFEDRSPLDWSLKLGDVARGDAEVARDAVSAAVGAADRWASLGAAGRATILRRLADLIDEHVEPLAAVECLDMAMLHESLRLRVIGRGASNFRAYADLADRYEPRRWSSNGTDNEVRRMPAGPTVVITPWNAPFMLSTWKSAPALAAGNPVVLKPAEWSPLSCSYLCDLAQEAGDVLLLRAQPSAIPAALDLSRQTLRVMRQNLFWAAGYNLLGIPLAAGALYPAFHILLSPWVAAAAMALSSVSVLGNSLRLRRWQPGTALSGQTR